MYKHTAVGLTISFHILTQITQYYLCTLIHVHTHVASTRRQTRITTVTFNPSYLRNQVVIASRDVGDRQQSLWQTPRSCFTATLSLSQVKYAFC